MRVLLSTYDSRGGVEPLVGLAVLFGRVAAVIHHGGAGTTTTAARAGAPQAVVPQMADQPSEHEYLQTLATGTGNGHGVHVRRSVLVMAARFVTPVQTPSARNGLPATSDRS